MISAFIDMKLDRNTSSFETLGELLILIKEEIVGSDIDKRGWQTF